MESLIMSEMDKEFNQALSFHEKDREKKEKQRAEGFNKPFDPIEQIALETNVDKVIRIVSGPFRQVPEHGDMVFKRNHNWDAKPVYISRIVGDSGKQFRCIWPHLSTNLSKTWLLWRVYNSVMKRERSVGGDPVYTYKKSFPSIFNKVAKNDKSRDNPHFAKENGWKPACIALLNVIDRSDPVYHKEKKHTKLLSKKVNENNGIFYYSSGVPFESVYETGLMCGLVKYYGAWYDYDVVVRKLGAKPWYELFHGVHDRIKIQDEVKSQIVEGFLTDEEKAYEKYDIDKLYAITKASTIKRNLGVYIESVDQALRTHYYEELLHLVNEEEKEKEKNANTGSKAEESIPEVVNEEVEMVREPARTPAEDTKLYEGDIPWDKLADGSFNSRVYKGVPLMTPEEKSMVIGIRSDGLFDYKEKDPDGKISQVYSFGEKGSAEFFKSPIYFHVCPLNGELFDEVKDPVI